MRKKLRMAAMAGWEGGCVCVWTIVSNHRTLQQGNQYELKLLASLTLVIVPWNNEIVFKVKHDQHNNHFTEARSRGRAWGNKQDMQMINKSGTLEILHFTFTI